MLWSRIQRKLRSEQDDKRLSTLAKNGAKMNNALRMFSGFLDEEDFQVVKRTISDIDKYRSIIFAYLVELSEGDVDLISDIRKIQYQTEQGKSVMFPTPASSQHDKGAFLSYETINKSFLSTIKQSLEDSLDDSNRNFKDMVKKRVGIWITPIMLVKKKGGGALSSQEKKELEHIEEKYLPDKVVEEENEENEEEVEEELSTTETSPVLESVEEEEGEEEDEEGEEEEDNSEESVFEESLSNNNNNNKDNSKDFDFNEGEELSGIEED